MATLAGRPIPRELIPLAGLPGTRVEMHVGDLGLDQATSAVVAVKAVDGAGTSDRRPLQLSGSWVSPVDRCRDRHRDRPRASRDTIAPPGRG